MAVELTFLGHAGFSISDGKHTVVIDPFLTDNPVAKHKPKDLKPDVIALTHGHADHVGDTPQIAKDTGCKIVAAFEICNYLQMEGLSADQCDPGNPGGRIAMPFGHISFTPAFHSSSYDGQYMGQPCGLCVRIGGVTIYHSGDTALFSDMKLIGELESPAIALVCAGDRFTMGPSLAARAVNWVGAQVAVPIHWGTWPMLAGEDELAAFNPATAEVKMLAAGESFSYDAD